MLHVVARATGSRIRCGPNGSQTAEWRRNYLRFATIDQHDSGKSIGCQVDGLLHVREGSPDSPTTPNARNRSDLRDRPRPSVLRRIASKDFWVPSSGPF